MSRDIALRWRDAFFAAVQQHETAQQLKEAALAGRLGDWTKGLTGVVVRSCEALGWRAAAKGYALDVLPQAGQEYLGMDIMAFEGGAAGRGWRFPVAVFELENSREDDRVAYSLWKVLCLGHVLRVVFAYRNDWPAARQLVRRLAEEVLSTLPCARRAGIAGETVLVIGSRGEGEAFPWGYFKLWGLDTNSVRFEKL